MARLKQEKVLAWMTETVKTPPLSKDARIEAGVLLRRLQSGEMLGLPHSRPMPSIGKRCHELRIKDERANWRLIYRIDADAIVIVNWFDKDTAKTPKGEIQLCQNRLKAYDATVKLS